MTPTERTPTSSPTATVREASAVPNRSWRFWPALPIYPYGTRRTIRRAVAPGMWTFEQVQGIFYVVVPIRMTVIALAAGGLLVYAPVAPTGECLQLVNELVAEWGDVKHIILPTISGLEHKVFVGPFARKFPQAQVWVGPDQWSFPLKLPLSWLGFPRDRTRILPANSSETPFGDEFDYAMLETIDLGPGQFAEVAVYHRASRTLLLTDAIVSIPAQPPEVVTAELYPLLFHARDRASDEAIDTPANRIKGWQRICLFSLYFQASVLSTPSLIAALQDATTAPDRSRRNYFGLYPFIWEPGWEQSFDRLRGHGRLFVAPILQTLILNRAPAATLAWVDRVASWDFQQIVPCHFDAPLTATPLEFRAAFDFLRATGKSDLPAADLSLLQQINRQLQQVGAIKPASDT